MSHGAKFAKFKFRQRKTRRVRLRPRTGKEGRCGATGSREFLIERSMVGGDAVVILDGIVSESGRIRPLLAASLITPRRAYFKREVFRDSEPLF